MHKVTSNLRTYKIEITNFCFTVRQFRAWHVCLRMRWLGAGFCFQIHTNKGIKTISDQYNRRIRCGISDNSFVGCYTTRGKSFGGIAIYDIF